MVSELWIQELLARLESLEEERCKHEEALKSVTDPTRLRMHTQRLERLEAKIRGLYAELEAVRETTDDQSAVRDTKHIDELGTGSFSRAAVLSRLGEVPVAPSSASVTPSRNGADQTMILGDAFEDNHFATATLDSSLQGPSERIMIGLTKVGDLIGGRYYITARLGEGGLGEVFEAFDRTLNRLVAIKKFRTPPGHNPVAMERFRRDAIALGSLAHPNIVTIHDVIATDDGGVAIVMERLRGKNLDQYMAVAIENGTILSRQLVDILMPVLRALEYAHSRGIIHRDVKPSNIFICEPTQGSGSVAKILDFGAAKFLDTTAVTQDPITGEGDTIGTPEYMAPEQIERSGPVDHRSDIYAVGTMLYYLLSASLPFERARTLQGLQQKAFGDPIPLLVSNPNVPPALAELIMKALSRLPTERHATIAALIEAIEAVDIPDVIPFDASRLKPRAKITQATASRVAMPGAGAWVASRQDSIFGDAHSRVVELRKQIDWYTKHLDTEYNQLRIHVVAMHRLWLLSTACVLGILVWCMILAAGKNYIEFVLMLTIDGFSFFFQRIFQARENYYRTLQATTASQLAYGRDWAMALHTIDVMDGDKDARQGKLSALVDILLQKMQMPMHSRPLEQRDEMHKSVLPVGTQE